MLAPIVIIGIGEMGGVFARAFLRIGHPVYPVLRDATLDEAAHQVAHPALVLITVPEGNLHSVLKQIPNPWQNCLVLLQNELLPHDWHSYNFSNLTVISVWFEKKPGQEAKVLLPSPAYGAGAKLLAQALQTLSIPTHLLNTEEELLFELVRKNVYILTTNIAGLLTGGDVETLWQQQRGLAENVAKEVLDLQEWRVGASLPRERLIAGMVEAIQADPQHQCTGRSAPARLERALHLAEKVGLAVPTLHKIANHQA